MHLARECVPEGRLTFHDYISDSPDIMRSLDVLVHTCDVEPFGRIAIEAMAASRPVVGPTAGGISETVLHEQTGLLVTPGDPTAFAAATLRLLRDQGLRERLGSAGRMHVLTNYTVSRQVKQLTSIYEKTLQWGRAEKKCFSQVVSG